MKNIGELFIEAARIKLRFQTTKGSISTEDLWDLPLTSSTGQVNLDQLAINAYNALDKAPTVSFVQSVPKGDPVNELRLELIKYVIEQKQVANKAKADALHKAEEKRKLLELLSRKQDASLEQLSEEDIRKRLEAL